MHRDFRVSIKSTKITHLKHCKIICGLSNLNVHQRIQYNVCPY
uniref:Uncharacterized protein MANES_13G155200 n=1 Tax=Rhizophora mucronata TaxID=61149 RepID=A0A2P2MS93_RHIMU